MRLLILLLLPFVFCVGGCGPSEEAKEKALQEYLAYTPEEMEIGCDAFQKYINELDKMSYKTNPNVNSFLYSLDLEGAPNFYQLSITQDRFDFHLSRMSENYYSLVYYGEDFIGKNHKSSSRHVVNLDSKFVTKRDSIKRFRRSPKIDVRNCSCYAQLQDLTSFLVNLYDHGLTRLPTMDGTVFFEYRDSSYHLIDVEIVERPVTIKDGEVVDKNEIVVSMLDQILSSSNTTGMSLKMFNEYLRDPK